VIGLMDRSNEYAKEPTSLEIAYRDFKAGLLRPEQRIRLARYLDCECGGNRTGLICPQSSHYAMREAMISGQVQPCETCACIGCSEGNCCDGHP